MLTLAPQIPCSETGRDSSRPGADFKSCHRFITSHSHQTRNKGGGSSRPGADLRPAVAGRKEGVASGGRRDVVITPFYRQTPGKQGKRAAKLSPPR